MFPYSVLASANFSAYGIRVKMRGAQVDFEQPDPPAYDHLAEITAPAVVVVGDLEYPMVTRCADSIADRIPVCRRTSAPGADHLIPLRAPDLVADVIMDQAS